MRGALRSGRWLPRGGCEDDGGPHDGTPALALRDTPCGVRRSKALSPYVKRLGVCFVGAGCSAASACAPIRFTTSLADTRMCSWKMSVCRRSLFDRASMRVRRSSPSSRMIAMGCGGCNRTATMESWCGEPVSRAVFTLAR